MRALFLTPGAAVPPRSLAVDCGLVAEATYSHWQGSAEAPPELRADTSTAMLVAAARDPARWLAGYDQVVNDHIDADGLLAMAVACQPHLALAHAPLLIGAAEAGDFSAWPGEDAFQLMLRLHRLIADERATGGAWEQRAVEVAATRLPELLAQARDPAYAAVARHVAQQRRDLAGVCAILRHPPVLAFHWDERLGHRSDSFLWTGEGDDLPPWVMDGHGGPGDFQLLAMASAFGAGTSYWLLAPGHSWARTVARPRVSWPDLAALAGDLQLRERGPGRWLAGPPARRHGFVCQLTCALGDAVAPSSLPIAVVLPLVARALDPGIAGQGDSMAAP